MIWILVGLVVLLIAVALVAVYIRRLDPPPPVAYMESGSSHLREGGPPVSGRP